MENKLGIIIFPGMDTISFYILEIQPMKKLLITQPVDLHTLIQTRGSVGRVCVAHLSFYFEET